VRKHVQWRRASVVILDHTCLARYHCLLVKRKKREALDTGRHNHRPKHPTSQDPATSQKRARPATAPAAGASTRDMTEPIASKSEALAAAIPLSLAPGAGGGGIGAEQGSMLSAFLGVDENGEAEQGVAKARKKVYDEAAVQDWMAKKKAQEVRQTQLERQEVLHRKRSRDRVLLRLPF